MKPKIEYKHLAVEKKVHDFVVYQAAKKGMKIRDYVAELVRRQAHEDNSGPENS